MREFQEKENYNNNPKKKKKRQNHNKGKKTISVILLGGIHNFQFYEVKEKKRIEEEQKQKPFMKDKTKRR